MDKVRVRYAPSPTGMLHIGGARSALYNYLFAKRLNGEFIVRMEDTDIERNVVGGEESQLEGLEWLGIYADESPLKPNPKYAPYRQMEKLELYRKIAMELVEKGYAYECYCSEDELEIDRELQKQRGIAAPKYNRRCLHATPEQIAKWKEEGRKPCIRLKLQDHHTIKFQDLVRGWVEFNNDDIGDWVIMKSNGIPTYNFAVVCDDHFMEISHVLRGEEHLSNTPKQIQVYEYLGWEIPTFGHMTLIINESGKKLSKRDPHIVQFIQQYKEMGYLPEAIFNFILLLGWSPEGENEIFTREEAISIFTPDRLSKSPSMFDIKKLAWINNEYVKKLSRDDVYNLCVPFLAKNYDLTNKSEEWVKDLVCLFQPQLVAGKDIVDLVKVFFEVSVCEDEEAKTLMDSAEAKKTVETFKALIAKEEVLTPESIKALLKQTQVESGNKGKLLYMPLRIALTGAMHGPDFTSLLMLLGKEEILSRLG